MAEFLEGIVLAAQIARIGLAVAGSFGGSSSPVIQWQGSAERATWCRLFRGDRFHRAGGGSNILEAPRADQQGTLFVPSMDIKDIISMSDYVAMAQGNNGRTRPMRCIDLTARKITTNPVAFDLFQGYRGIYVKQNSTLRFFLNNNTGPNQASLAFKRAINGNDDTFEIVMGTKDLHAFVAFLSLVNDMGGYGVCEISRINASWYGVRGITMIGQAASVGQVQIFSGKVAPLGDLFKGKRYLNEYTTAHFVGAGVTRDMLNSYYTVDFHPCQTSEKLPIAWLPSNASSDHFWRIKIMDTLYSVASDGTIWCVKEEKVLRIKRPLFGTVFTLKNRSSKSCCPSLLESGVTDQSIQSSGYKSVLSVLGASVRNEDGTVWHGPSNVDKIDGRVRVDNIEKFVEKVSAKKSNCLSANILPTATMHKAGRRGKFPVYMVVPIVKIDENEYNCETFAAVPSNAAPPKSVRYIQLCQSPPSSENTTGFPTNFSDWANQTKASPKRNDYTLQNNLDESFGRSSSRHSESKTFPKNGPLPASDVSNESTPANANYALDFLQKAENAVSATVGTLHENTPPPVAKAASQQPTDPGRSNTEATWDELNSKKDKKKDRAVVENADVAEDSKKDKKKDRAVVENADVAEDSKKEKEEKKSKKKSKKATRPGKKLQKKNTSKKSKQDIAEPSSIDKGGKIPPNSNDTIQLEISDEETRIGHDEAVVAEGEAMPELIRLLSSTGMTVVSAHDLVIRAINEKNRPHGIDNSITDDSTNTSRIEGEATISENLQSTGFHSHNNNKTQQENSNSSSTAGNDETDGMWC